MSSPPLPNGTEIVRPNQDILVRLFQPRPVFLYINDSIDTENPVDSLTPIYAPSFLETFDDNTGCPTGVARARMEVGFSIPSGFPSWGAIKVRLRAARSRPPQPEAARVYTPKIQVPSPLNCPDPVFLYIQKVNQLGSWQIPFLEEEITEILSHPSNRSCCLTAWVTAPPGPPLQVALQEPPGWDLGWRRLEVIVIARARALAPLYPSAVIGGFNATTVSFDNTTSGVAGPPAYQVEWTPFDCGGALSLHEDSRYVLIGNSTLRSNIPIHATFGLNTINTDYLHVLVSLDGVTYTSTVTFDLTAYESITIFYRIGINFGNITPLGNRPIGISFTIAGPSITTAADLTYGASGSPAMSIEIYQDTSSTLSLTSRCKLTIQPLGNDIFSSLLPQETEILTEDLAAYHFIWDGFWTTEILRDFACSIQAVGMEIDTDLPVIDVSYLSAEIYPYCPGFPGSVPTQLLYNHVILKPNSDVVTTGWLETPLWSHLISDVTKVSSDFITTDPTQPNQAKFGFPLLPTSPSVPSGYTRSWTEINILIQALATAEGSTQSVLNVSTNFGASQESSILTEQPNIYAFYYFYNPGLTSDQINRLNLSIVAEPLVTGSGVSQVKIAAIQVSAIYQDLLNPPGPPAAPPTPPAAHLSIVNNMSEVFSCGSLGDCSSPKGVCFSHVHVINPSGSSAYVSFIPNNGLNLRVFDVVNTTTEYSLYSTLAANTSMVYALFGWVGSLTDAYPGDAREGTVLVKLDYGSGVEYLNVPWYYIGF